MCQCCYFCCKTDILFSQILRFDLNVLLNTNLQDKEPERYLIGINNNGSPWKRQVTFPGPQSHLHPGSGARPLEGLSFISVGLPSFWPQVWILATCGVSQMTAESSLDVL